MPDTTPRFLLPYILPSQAQKHVTHNEALRLIDVLVHGAVEDEAAAPPADPAEGACHLVAAGATGAFAGQDGALAAFVDGAWSFVAPVEGMRLWRRADARVVVFSAGAWTDLAAALGALDAAALAAGGIDRLGVNAAADAVNRLAVKTDAVLLSHDDVTPGSGDMRLVVDKAAAGATASVVFQTGWSGRAEFGLAGDDDWRVKVSPDGVTWHEALTVDRGTGRITLHDQLTLRDGNLVMEREDWQSAQITVCHDVARAQFKGRRARGSLAAPAPVAAGDTLVSLTPEAYDGATYALCGGFHFFAQSDFAVRRDVGARLAVVHDGVWTETLRVDSNGNTGIGRTPQTSLDVAGPMRPASYAVANLPAPAGIAGALVFVSDEAGGPVPAFSDGAAWRRVTDRAVVS
ncbi:DUF2793 domain-containing protein [Aquibium sp. A9E412]|uniref:DUF2793 domain-containing protein n=1 Tax=Aquibium sp. A9E412 TaxID=2976767 RepID=UPI0025AF2A45|nr:DUF2793 domain-containing protein [Aquibium sp. A9E412]MDN2566096.1 DUF2793 domain-containing protein [Aquibium sp. A9E412]